MYFIAQHVHNGTLTEQAGCRRAGPARAFCSTVRAKGQMFLVYLLVILYHPLVVPNLN